MRLEFGPAPRNVNLRRLEDGSWGPLGIYGKRIPRSDLIDLLRNTVKPNRIHRIEEVLMHVCRRLAAKHVAAFGQVVRPTYSDGAFWVGRFTRLAIPFVFAEDDTSHNVAGKSCRWSEC